MIPIFFSSFVFFTSMLWVVRAKLSLASISSKDLRRLYPAVFFWGDGVRIRANFEGQPGSSKAGLGSLLVGVCVLRRGFFSFFFLFFLFLAIARSLFWSVMYSIWVAVRQTTLLSTMSTRFDPFGRNFDPE
jgi:hypothetical protein